MHDCSQPILAALNFDFVAAYWFCLIVGGGLLLISSVAGGHTESPDLDALHADPTAADFGLDAHVDADSFHAPHATELSRWFSLRFLIFFAASFGALGVVLSHLTTLNTGLVLAAALGGGVAIGQAVHHLMRRIRASSGNSAPSPLDYVNKRARVSVAIDPPRKGEVELQVRQGRRFVPAVAGAGAGRFDIGQEVVVVDYRAGVAEVVALHDFPQSATPI